ncbi:hypothetical protein M9Y10_011297 [Tritrichomonas musculus]|uniref:Uncharacterized protein n=1 Tax=Tritrichomonas musculus TaxID=1915356 RepID=A0ABR2IJ26_9EUKA
MKLNKTRLSVYDQLSYQRAKETFPKEEGTCPEETFHFINLILEVNENSEAPTIQNAINFARSWAELGFILPQEIMNKILRAAFQFPIFIPQLSLLASFFHDASWLFNALLKLIKKQPDLIKKSIQNNFEVWNFILKYFDKDFFEKSESLDIDYSERQFAFLSEVLIFKWPQDQYETTISNNVKSISQFCASLDGEVPDAILNCLAPLFPKEVISSLSGKIDKLNSQTLAYFYSLGLNENKDFTGNKLVMALKLIPRNSAIAQQLANELDEEDSKTFQQMLKHYNTTTKHFTIV